MDMKEGWVTARLPLSHTSYLIKNLINFTAKQ